MLSLAAALSMVPNAMALQEIPRHVATTPAHRLSEDWWKQRHEACVATTKRGSVDLVFLGDSITQGWESTGKPTWDEKFAPLRAANFGFSGDRTEHVLWRLENGEILGLSPKLVVIMIGTNNFGHGSSNAGQTADGVRAIVAKLLGGLPGAKILLLGIFPRGAKSEDPMRVAAREASAQFMSLADGKRVFFQDVGRHFVRENGDLRATLMPDLLHLNPSAYAIWGKAIEPEVHRLMGLND
jgi:beta-glucosidase